MTPTKIKTPALVQLDELHQAVIVAQRAAAAASAEQTASARWLPAAQAELASYLTAVEQGDVERDVEVERARRDQVTDLEAMRVAVEQVGSTTRYADRRAIARHQDALDCVQDAQSAVAEFIVEHRDELQAAMVDRALVARDRLLDAIGELSGAHVAWQACARDWRPMLERWGLSPAELPLSPLPGTALADIEQVALAVAGGARDPRGAIPAPVSLTPGGEGEERHTTPLRGWEHWPRIVSSEAGLGA